ncbi:30S ribosomal protein S13 [Candidatus Giovannonibacteria bacterium]|nr:30S ribosomal protein S13 [Candidatus Giovannonibacteria bacterium]
MRIAGTNVPDNKRLEVALTYIYGIGSSTARKILVESNVSPDKKAKEISGAEINRLRNIIEKNYRIEGELRRDILLNIRRLKEIGSYRGARHARSLPVRGQRTKTNSRTRRGNVRKTMGSGKRKLDKK